MAFKRFLFSGGAMGGGQTVTPDTFTTTDTVEMLIGLGEGPIQGPAGPQDIYADNTALQNANGEPNLTNFSLDFYPGADGETSVNMLLGGVASPTAVGTQLAKNVPVVHTTNQQNLDFVDVRLVIDQLGKDSKSGSFPMGLSVLIECKPTSSQTWAPAFEGSAATSGTLTGGTGVSTWVNNGLTSSLSSFTLDRQIVAGAGAPTAAPTDPNATGFDTNDPTKVYHWDSGSPQWYSAAITPVNGEYGTYVDPTTNATIRVYITATAPTDARAGDVWKQASDNWLLWNGTAWVDPAAFENYQPNPHTLVNGVWTFNGKISSATPVNIRIKVNNIAETYDFRVTKQTFDNTTQSNGDVLSSVVQWESLQEIKSQPFTFTNLAMLRLLARATDQFTSLPTIYSVQGGRIVNVPSNYDPVARTYTGVWDGTFKKAYTNNPAWCCLDFVQNTTYGMSSVYPQNANIWAFYAWGQQCDVMVPTAAGGTQPRWTYNDLITEPRNAKEMAQYIAGASGALLIDDGAGNVTVVVDENDSAVAVFTLENVSKDGFQYSYTDRLTRANDTRPKFINPAYNWVPDHRELVDQTDIDNLNGARIVDDFIAVGCIDVDEAMRRARRRQIMSLTEKEFVTFTTNRKGRYISEWDIILVADPKMGFGDSRRIRAVTGANSVSLRDPITLEPGFTYQATFDFPNPAYPATSTEPYATQTFNITTAPGTVTSLSFDANLPTNLPEFAGFALGCAGVVGLPKPYRILRITDDAGAGEVLKVTALELNRNKYAYIDGTAASGTAPNYNIIDTQTVLPPVSPTIAVSYRQQGGLTVRVLTVSWQASPSEFITTYHVYHSLNGSPATLIDSQGQLSIELVGADEGVHTFDVYAVNTLGRESQQPASLGFDVTGTTKAINPPGSITGRFAGHDAVFEWGAPAADPNFDHYQLQILLNGTVVRTIQLSELAYIYKFADNVADGAGTPNRTVEASLCCVDADGTLSTPITYSVTNAAPTPVTVTISETSSAINFAFPDGPPTDVDYAGIDVWLYAATGTPLSQANLVWSALGVPQIPAIAGKTYYGKYAFKDSFGDGAISAEFNVTTPTIDASQFDTQLQQQLADAANAAADATNAANSATDAANSATAAANSSAAATSAAGQANTYAGNASTSADNAAAAASTAGTAATNAQASAQTATTQASAATTAASAAQASALLSASFNSASLVKDPTFQTWTDANSLPDYWAYWNGNNKNLLSKTAGTISPNAIRFTQTTGGPDQGFLSPVANNQAGQAGWYVVEITFKLVSGSVAAGLGWYLQGTNAAGTSEVGNVNASFASTSDISGNPIGAGVAGNTYRIVQLAKLNGPGAAGIQLFVMSWAGAFGSPTAFEVDFEKVSVRPASSAEILANTANTEATTNSATISSNQQAQATQNTAFSSSITTLNAQVMGNNNMCPYGNCEAGFTGWGGWGPGAMIYDDQVWGRTAFSGTYNGNFFIGSQHIAMAPSTTYTISGNIQKNNGATGAVLGVNFYDSSSNYLGGTGYPSQSAGFSAVGPSYVQTFTSPANTSYCIVYVGFYGTTNVSGYFQRIKLEIGSHATSYDNTATVTQQASALSTLSGQVYGQYALTVDAGGNVAGMTLFAAGGPQGVTGVSFEADLFKVNGKVPFTYDSTSGDLLLASPNGQKIDLGNGRIIFDNGSVMKVAGVGFGANSDLIEWFGPSIAIGSCTKANATAYQGTDGSAYFGGSLKAGTLTTKAATSSTSASAVAETSVFGSNGGTITVTLSYTYSDTESAQITSTAQWNSLTGNHSISEFTNTGNDSGTSVQLYRSINGGAYALVATLNMTGSWSADYSPGGLSPSDPGNATYQDHCSGSLTYTDPQNVAQNRQYKAVISSRSAAYTGNISQNISVICVE